MEILCFDWKNKLDDVVPKFGFKMEAYFNW